MRVLIVFATRHGQAAKVANRIARVAGSLAGVRCTTCDLSIEANPSVTEFDGVIVVGSVVFGRHPRPLVRFLKRHYDALGSKHAALVSVSNASASPAGHEEASEYVARLLQQVHWLPSAVEYVAGAIPFSRYGRFTRWIVLRTTRQNGRDLDPARDYEFTDWDAVDEFAQRFTAGVETKVA
jgi:menaquinone-dependent protoporphyrinogen oxidase